MSGKVIGAILDLGRYEGKTLTVAMTLAEYADDDGGDIFPLVETLAARAKTSVRMTQLALARLRADGVLITVKEARRGRPAVHRIDLVRVQALRCNGCGAKNDTIAPQLATDEVQSIAPQSSNIEEPPVEAPKEAPTMRAREAAPVGEQVSARKPHQAEMLMPITGRKPVGTAYADAEIGLLHAEFARCPGFKETWSSFDVQRGLDALGAAAPPIAALIPAVKRYAQWLTEMNRNRAKHRDGREPMTRPYNWLAQRAYEQFLSPPMRGPDAAATVAGEAPCDPSWGEWRERAIEMFGTKIFDAWLAVATLELSDGRALISARSPFVRDYINTNYAFKLTRLFKREVEIVTKARAA